MPKGQTVVQMLVKHGRSYRESADHQLHTEAITATLAATREAGDHALAAAVPGHMAFVPAFGRRPDGARNLLAAAVQHTGTASAPSGYRLSSVKPSGWPGSGRNNGEILL
jgi:hypothetical protein